MRQLLDQVQTLNRERSHRKGLLSREVIDSALSERLDLTVEAIRALSIDVNFERQYVEAAGDLLEDKTFQEAVEEGHVTYGMIKPFTNQAKAENRLRSEEAVAAEIVEAIAPPLVPTVIRATYMPKETASGFYENLRGLRGNDDIFNRVTSFISSGAITGMVLLDTDGGDAIAAWRGQIGSTDPQKADEGTIRRRFADSMDNNVVHGSDSVENVKRELGIFRKLL